MSTLGNLFATKVALNELEAQAKRYAGLRQTVKELVTECDDEVRAILRRKRPGILKALAQAKDAQAGLAAAVQKHPELFVQPRTITLQGIKIGFAKGAGKVVWTDKDEVIVARIDKMFSREEAEMLIISTRTPSKEALRNLEAKDLARLGVEVEGTGDVVIVKSTDTDCDRLVKWILKEGAVEEVEG